LAKSLSGGPQRTGISSKSTNLDHHLDHLSPKHTATSDARLEPVQRKEG
jgi:hypothetical protein